MITFRLVQDQKNFGVISALYPAHDAGYVRIQQRNRAEGRTIVAEGSALGNVSTNGSALKGQSNERQRKIGFPLQGESFRIFEPRALPSAKIAIAFQASSTQKTVKPSRSKKHIPDAG